MGFFGLGRDDAARKRPAPPRRPPADPDVQLKRNRNRALRMLESRDPNTWMRAILGREGFLPEESKPDEVEQYLSTATKLQRAGLLPHPEAPPTSGVHGWVEALLAGLGSNPLIAARVAALMGPGPMVTVEPGPQYREGRAVEDGVPVAPPTRPQLAAPAPTPVEPAPAQPPAPTTQPIYMEDDPNMLPPGFARLAISQLSGKTPEQAARMLVEFPNAQAHAMVGKLCETVDAGIPGYLFALAQQHPDTAPLVQWLLAEHNIEWTLMVVHAMRAISGVQPLPSTVAPGTATPQAMGWG